MSETLQKWAKVFSALGNEERLAVLSYLLAHSRSNCTQIAEAVKLSTPALSYHLRFLEEAGLIVRERRGRRRCVRVSPELRKVLRPALVEALRKEGEWSTK